MSVRFILKESICNCELHITDNKGTRMFFLDVAEEPFAEIEDIDSDFHITVIPRPADYKSIFDGLEQNAKLAWKERIAPKVTLIDYIAARIFQMNFFSSFQFRTHFTIHPASEAK